MRKLLYSPQHTLSIPFALTPMGQLHQSPPSPVPGVLGRCPSHQSHELEHRETYGQAQGRSGGHQGSSVNRRYQLSFVGRLWYRRSPLPQESATSQCLSALPGRLGRGKFVLDGLGCKDKNQRTHYSYTTTAWWLSTLRCN